MEAEPWVEWEMVTSDPIHCHHLRTTNSVEDCVNTSNQRGTSLHPRKISLVDSVLRYNAQRVVEEEEEDLVPGGSQPRV